jgi:hypothetical protein
VSIRTIAGLALVYVALYGLPKIDVPSLPLPQPSPVAPDIEEPSKMVVAKICEQMDAFDRLVWMSTWEEAAGIVAGDSETASVEFQNTLGMQVWQESVFDIAWRRMAKASGKYKGLGEAVEQAFVDTFGTEVRPVTPDMLEDICDLYEALAWAGARAE